MKIKTLRFNRDKAHSALSKCILDLLEEIDTPRALALAISYRTSPCVDLELLKDPLPHANNAHNLRLDLQAIALFKKSTYLDTGKDLEKEAIERFFNIEEELQVFNGKRRYNFIGTGIIYTASRILRNLLGPVPNVEDLNVSFTSGATFSKTVSESTLADKLSSVLDVTPNCYSILHDFLCCESHARLLNAYNLNDIKVVRGSKFSTVNNDFRKSRTICKEPLGNMLLQRAIGLHLKDRLKRVKIYISTGKETHTSLLEADPTLWATIDQSDASDRISDRLVKDLLTPEWYDLLNSIRSQETLVGDSWHRLNKFMTQGNGFTFELETCIFYALAQSICINLHGKRAPLSVHGDDILVAQQFGREIINHLPEFGLAINFDKSYADGEFKESCGFDSYKGQAVRPYFLKEFEEHEVLFYVQLCNYIRRVSKNISGGTANMYYSRAWKRSLSYIKTDNIFFGPESLGDSVIVTDEKPSDYKRAFYANNRLTVTAYRKRYRESSYRKPVGTGAETAYALLGGSSSGSLIRNSDYSLESARAFPVNWD